MRKIFASILIFFLSTNTFSEQLSNQDVDIASGSTVSNDSGLTIQQLTGGPYTVVNAGTIEASNITSNSSTIRIEVDTTVTNSGLIDTAGSKNLNSILFIDNSGSNSLTNSGTIQTETTGDYGQAIHVQDTSVTAITNSSGGTIKVTDSALNSGAIRINTGGSVNTITNNGTISAVGTTHSRGIISISTATIDRITNTGTISASGSSNSNHGIVFWNNSGTSITNSGTIQGTGGSYGYGIRIGESGNISSITNSGTIKGSKDGIANSNTITSIINTGTITGTSGYSIHNVEGSITNLTNSQNNLTLIGNVPTNYYVKVNSSSSYGKVSFTSASGSMNIGIADDSTLTEGTYEAVVSGLGASNISNSSGTYISDANHYKYSVSNSSGTQWDLVVNDLTEDVQCSVDSGSGSCTKTSCITSSIETGMNAVTNSNFAHMNTYDCDTFGESGSCLSIGGRGIFVNDPQSEIGGVVLVYGKKQSSNLRWGTFLHHNISYNTPSNFTLSNDTPMIGFYGVWNEKVDHTGLQFKIGNSYQATNAVITRPVVGVSDQATGNTSLYNNQVILELRNNKKISDSFTLSPYFATLYSQKYQKGYTETGIDLPLTYNKIIDTSMTAITGIKFRKNLNKDYSFFGTIGLEHDLSHQVSALSPTGVSGLTTVDLTKSHEPTRPVIAIGYDHQVSDNQILRIKGQYQELPYQGMNETNLYASYNFLF
ncbi:MAG: autotransporter domain-containing protein [Alphaproteobacteria bacterium]